MEKFVLSVPDVMNDATVPSLTNADCGIDRMAKCPASLIGLLFSQSLENKTKVHEIYGSTLGQVTSYQPHT
jgi:hypothetical protein